MPALPTHSGRSGTAMPRVPTARANSHSAPLVATSASTTKASSRRKRLARRSASRPRPTPIAAGRLRPARPPGFGGAGVTRARWAPAWIWRICRRVSGGSPPVVLTACSDLEQLSLLAGEKLVDGVDALLRQALELLLRTVDLVLADVAVLLQAVELVLGLAAV